MKRKALLAALVCLIFNLSVASNESDIPEVKSNFVEIDGVTLCQAPSAQIANPTLSSYFKGLFSTDNWPARWTCGDWSQTEGWLYISSDISIFLAYLSIPIMLLWFIRKIELGKLKWLIALFGAFILLCGFTHLIDVILFWEPMYRFSGFTKLITGVVSLTTATVLGFVIPKALEYKSPEVLQNEIEERKKIQAQFDLFMAYSPGAVAMFDKDMHYIMVNQGWCKTYSLERQDIIGKSHYEIFPSIMEMPEWLDYHKRALNGEACSSDFDSFKTDDDITYVRWKLEPWYESDEKVGGLIMFTEVITEEVLVQEKLKESELRFTNIFNKAHFSIALVNDRGIPFHVNQQFCDLLGYSEEKLTKMHFSEFTHPDDIEKDIANYDKLLRNEIDSYTIDKRYITKNGKIKHVKLNVTLVNEGLNDVYALALIEDTTQAELMRQKKKQSEEKVKEMNERFAEISDISGIGTWEVDIEEAVCYWSDAVYDIHEEEKGKLIRLEDGINYYHPDHREIISNAVNDAIANQTSWDLELKIVTTHGNEKWVRAIGRVIYKNGKPEKLQGLFQDIDIKKRYELDVKKSKKELEDLVNQRTLDLKTANEELESFSYSISHDLRAPLRAINGFSQAIIEDYAKEIPEEATKYLNRIAANADKMGGLIDDLLEFSRMNRKKVSQEEVDLDSLVTQLIEDIFPDSKHLIEVVGLPSISCDPIMITQVFTNLISNAIKYSSKEEKPKIILSGKEDDDATVISIKDNGAGFNMNYYDKLFQVFQRLHTESEFEGTGVGLSLCAKIMKSHGGEIWAESEPEKGAIFYLRFKKV